MRFRIIILAILILTGIMDSVAQKTTRKGLKRLQTEVVAEETVELDTIRYPGDNLSLSGYEKPLRSRKETLHVTNNLPFDIVELQFNIIYVDYKGEELHSRKVKLIQNLPAFATQLVSFPTWDIQNRFYYRNGPVPKSDAYPYDIMMSVDWIVCREKNKNQESQTL
ncbi:MAG: hypothetical protein J1E99_06860 [Muribaculaceae bacterium]|nr:hypothetical protein [Muribaculaceae bacterium]